MMFNKTPLILITFLIGFVSIANLIRALWNIPVMIGNFILPGWTGAIFFIFLGLLTAWASQALISSCRQPKDPSNR